MDSPTVHIMVQDLTNVLQRLWFIISTACVIVFSHIIGSIKACLPLGWLPRKSVAGKIVLITGSGNGLGRRLALQFAALGSKLVLWDIATANNEETAELCRKHGVSVAAYTVNVSDRSQVYAMAKKVKHEVGSVNILVNNAGVVTGKSLLDLPDEQIERTMSINATAHFWTLKAFLPDMLEQNEGHIVCLSSAAGQFGLPKCADYCASKFATVGLMESLVAELDLIKSDIKTTLVCPSFTATDMFKGAYYSWQGMMTPEVVIDRTMDAILTNQAVIMMPRLNYLLWALKVLTPHATLMYLFQNNGHNDSMNNFVGKE